MNISRRKAILSLIGFGAYTCACVGCRSSAAKHAPRHGVISLGKAQSLQQGANVKTIERVVVFKDVAGLSAMSMVCTHQECLLNKSANGYECPCHGALFSSDGVVLRGPAQNNLEYYELTLKPNDEIELNFSRIVKKDWRLSVPN